MWGEAPGFSIDFVDGVVAEYEYPIGKQWRPECR